MEKIKKTIFIIATIIFCLIIFNVNEVNAALQSNPRTHASPAANTPTGWISAIRQMESSSGAMGLSEAIDATTLEATTDSNGIDIHMIKTTEYGATAILSASPYGNPNNEQAITSTTNNASGVQRVNRNIWTAGGLKGSIFGGVNVKYYDTYTDSQNSARVGDALGSSTTTNSGCYGWHSSYSGGLFWVGSSYPYLNRGANGLFSFSNGHISHTYTSRAVVICGEGF